MNNMNRSHRKINTFALENLFENTITIINNRFPNEDINNNEDYYNYSSNK